MRLPEMDKSPLRGAGVERAIDSWLLVYVGRVEAVTRWPIQVVSDSREDKSERMSYLLALNESCCRHARAGYSASATWSERS